MKITPLRLLHNHMTIEPVIEIFGHYDRQTTLELRDVIFRRFAASGQCGMIVTLMMDFDLRSEWDYLEHIKSFFRPYDTEFYYVQVLPSHRRRGWGGGGWWQRQSRPTAITA